MVDATPGYGMWPQGYGYGRDNDCCEMGSDLSRQIAEAVYNMVNTTQGQNLAAIAATNAAAQAAQEIASETRSDVNRISGDIRLAQSESESRLGSAVERNGGETRTDINRVSGDIRLSQSESESRVAASVERNGGDTRLSQSESESRLGMAIERNGGDTRSTVERNSGEIRQNLSDGNAELRRELANNHNIIQQAVYNSASELRNIGAVNHASQLLEIERSRFATVEARCHIERQAAENLARIQHEASENKYELATKMAECCCKIEEAVHDEGCKTRGLIEKNEIDRLREALEHARRESDHHRNNESIRLTVQQFANQSQRVYAPAPVTTTPPAA